MHPVPGPTSTQSRIGDRSTGRSRERRRLVPTWKELILKKQVLVSVDRAETRVALLEAGGAAHPPRSSASRKAGSASKATKATPARKRGSGGGKQADYRIGAPSTQGRGGGAVMGD